MTRVNGFKCAKSPQCYLVAISVVLWNWMTAFQKMNMVTNNHSILQSDILKLMNTLENLSVISFLVLSWLLPSALLYNYRINSLSKCLWSEHGSSHLLGGRQDLLCQMFVSVSISACLRFLQWWRWKITVVKQPLVNTVCTGCQDSGYRTPHIRTLHSSHVRNNWPFVVSQCQLVVFWIKSVKLTSLSFSAYIWWWHKTI